MTLSQQGCAVLILLLAVSLIVVIVTRCGKSNSYHHTVEAMCPLGSSGTTG